MVFSIGAGGLMLDGGTDRRLGLGRDDDDGSVVLGCRL